jgi:hypothetical protein
MRIRYLVVVSLATLMFHGAVRSQSGTPIEPQYGQQYNAVQDGRLIVLERETAVTDTKSRRNFVISPNTKVFERIPNTGSTVRVGPATHFVVRLATGDRDPQTLVQLRKLVVGKTDRQIPIVTYRVSMIPGGGVNHQRAPQESIPVAISKYGASSLEIIPQAPLEPGEYAFISGHEAQCFGVDAGAAGGTTPAIAKAPLPPPPPAHPAASIVDLPPAASGYPPLHASAPAAEGCWWTPFLAQKLSLEMLVQQCERGKSMGGNSPRFIADDNGVSVLTDGTNDATQILTIHSKPASQPIILAIQQQFVNKLDDPAARESCKVSRDIQPTTSGETYSVEATGPYSKLKKFDDSEGTGENPCPGLSTEDGAARSFLYLPQDSKTKFILIQTRDSWPFDTASIHFHAE